jgi:uncharacterized protein YukE
VSIEVEPAALDAAARGYAHAAASLRAAHDGLSTAIDRVAGAAANQHVTAGAAAYHAKMTAALRALAERTDQHGGKVRAAAVSYHDTDRGIARAAAAAEG